MSVPHHSSAELPGIVVRRSRAKSITARAKRSLFRFIRAASFVAAVLLAAPHPSSAQTNYTWRSESVNGNLDWGGNWWNLTDNHATNWGFGVMNFDNNINTANNANTSLSAYRFVFTANATDARTFTGNTIRFYDYGGANGGIFNQSSATHVFNNNLEGDGVTQPFEINIAGTGGLTFGGTIDNKGTAINVQGTTASAATVTFGGVISGSGGFFKTNSNTTVVFDAANTMSGQLTIGAGTVKLNNAGDTFGSADQAVRIGNGGTLDLNGVNATVASVAEIGSGNGGVISLGAGTLTLANQTGALFQNSISGGGGLTKGGAGTLTLYGSQTYTGATTVNAGALIVTNVTLASTSFVLNSGGRLETRVANTIADASSFTLSGGNLYIWNNDIIGNNGVTLTADTTSSIGANAGTITINGNVTGNGNLVIYQNALHLNSVNNDLSGTVFLQRGSLRITNSASLGTATLQMGSGTTNNTFLVSNNVTRTAGLGITNGSSGSLIEVAANSTFTQSGNLTQVGGSSTNTAFAKAGAGTLLLEGTGGTFAGQVKIGDGTVIVAANNALNTNISTATRGIDLGLNITNASQANNVSLLGRDGVTVSNSIYVAPNTSDATRTIGLDGTGTTTFNNEIYLDGTLTVTAGASGNTLISGNIRTNDAGGGGGLVKAGAGTVTLTGANTYNGATAVGAGTLLVNGSAANSAVTVSNNATLGGSGTVGATTLLSGSTIAPGNSAGTLNINGAHAWNEGANYEWEIFNLDGPAGTGWDLLSVTGGTLDLTGITTSGGFTINLVTLQADNSTQGALTDFDPNANYTNWLIASAPTISGFSTNLFNLDSSLFDGATGTFAIEQRAIDGGQGLFLTYNGGGAPIPEPGTWAAAALLAGTAGLVGWRRRRARSGQQAA